MERVKNAFYRFIIALCMSLPLVFIAACELPQEAEPVLEDNSKVALKSMSILPDFPGADKFVEGFTNLYVAFDVGKVFHYAGETEDGEEEVIVWVKDETYEVMGVTTTVVYSEEYLDGELMEYTEDWFAEDQDGNVWYFGEYSLSWDDEEEEWTDDGSWEAGVDGAEPGILMYAHPKMGMKYQQEYYEGEAEDMAMVINLDKTVQVGDVVYEGCLETMDWTPLEPGEREHKFYHPGTGLVMELQPKEGRITIELVDVEMP